MTAAPPFTLHADEAGRVRACDDAAVVVLGRARDALVGRSLDELVPGVRLDAPGVQTGETSVHAAHGRRLHAEVWVSSPRAGERVVMVRETPVELPVHRLFGARLSDLLRREPDPAAVLKVAVEAVGEELGASRVSFARVAADGDLASTAAAWTDGGQAPFGGSLALARLLGGEIAAGLRRGETLAQDDTLADGRLPVSGARRLADLGVRGLCVVPLLSDGRLTHLLVLHTAWPKA